METFENRYASLCAAIQKYMPDINMDRVNLAVDYAREKHKDQKRKDGSPYVIHPLAVAEIVAELGLDEETILGALLHDCIEDTDASFDEIVKLFGQTCAELVEGVTKLTRANFTSNEQEQMENLRKMFMAMSKDIRVVLIKIADRLHNMRTMQYQTPAKQLLKCRETMDIYAPLAYRLGMQKVKWELEDIALRYIDPASYTAITDHLKAQKEKDEAFMNAVQERIRTRLEEVGIHNRTYGRIKHVYSIYRKMNAQDKTMDELYDIYAFRVLVDSIHDCYNVLGHIHDLFKEYDHCCSEGRHYPPRSHRRVRCRQGSPEARSRRYRYHRRRHYACCTGDGRHQEHPCKVPAFQQPHQRCKGNLCSSGVSAHR